MKFHKYFIDSFFVGGLCLLSCSALHAADTGPARQETLIVTAHRTPVDAQQVGSSLTVITRQHIENSQANLVSDLLREVAGLAVNRQGPVGSFTQLRVRGAEANQVLVLIDGIEANDLAGGSEFDFAHLSTDNIERIEVLRGAQSAVWGSDALAGVVNIITRRGSGTGSATAFAGAGSLGSFETGGAVSGGTSAYHYAFSASHLDTSGSNISANGDEQDGYENTTVSLKTGVSPLDNLHVDFVFRHTSADSEIDRFDLNNTLVDDDRVSEVEQLYSRLQASLGLFNDAWQHTAGLAVTATDRNTLVADIEDSSTQGKKLKWDYQSTFAWRTQQWLDSSHGLTFAIDHEKEQYRSSGQASLFGDPNFNRSAEATGYVAEYRFGLLDRWFLSGSLRHDDNTEFEDATTYRISSAYLVPETQTRLRMGYGTGVKNPTFNERFGFSVGGFIPFIGNANLKPERSKGWDVAIEQSLFDQRLLFELVYFRERLEDEINGFVFINGFTAATAQNVVGKSQRQGWEFSAQANITDNLSARASYSNIDSTQPDNSGRQVREIRRPKELASLNLNYQFLQRRANVNLAVNYNGSQLDTDFNTFANQRLSSYVLVNLGTSWQINQYLEWYGRIDNLLDERYEEALGFQSSGISGFTGLRLRFNPLNDAL